MYLVMKNNEKIIVDTVRELEDMGASNCKVYSLALLDTTELIFDGEIRDCIYKILKGEQMEVQMVINSVQDILGISETKIKKVISKMKKEKIIYYVEDMYDLEGHRWIGILD